MKPKSPGVVAVALVVCLHATAWGCRARVPPAATPADPSPSSPPAPPSFDCALIEEPGEPIATVAVAGPVDPANAPRPSNDSERVLFRQLYETLIRIDCQGHIAPGLAESWRLDADGETWIVTLRENARFSDGTPVTAAEVLASWTRNGLDSELRPDVGHLLESVAIVAERVLALKPRSRHANAPLALAHPHLAIARPAPQSPWPIGTRSARVVTDGPADVITVARDDGPPIRFTIASDDPRDLLDQGVDLLLTRDRATLDYAATLPHLDRLPLAWRRVHVLLTPGRSPASPSLPEEARQALADDAVRGEARGARGPFWWETQGCALPPPMPRQLPAPTPRVVYEAGDEAARDLAERFVGLARAPGPASAAILDALLPDRPRRTFQRATGLTAESLARTMRLGIDAGYVISVTSQPIDPCRELRVLMDAAPWLDPSSLVPLVETRLHAVVRRGRSGVIAEWDGGLVFTSGIDPR